MDRNYPVTATEAALLLQTSVAVICMWRTRGYLTDPSDPDSRTYLAPVGERGRSPLYRSGDVLDAARAVNLSRAEHPGSRRAARPPWPGYETAAA